MKDSTAAFELGFAIGRDCPGVGTMFVFARLSGEKGKNVLVARTKTIRVGCETEDPDVFFDLVKRVAKEDDVFITNPERKITYIYEEVEEWT